MRTIYIVKVFGRPLHAIGVRHWFDVEFSLSGTNHSDSEIRLGIYKHAGSVKQWEIVSQQVQTIGGVGYSMGAR